jgi:hypothetical protein
LRVQRAVFSKIDDVDFYFFEAVGLKGEIEPLDVSARVGVDPHEEIVLMRANLDDCIQVAAFEVAVKGGFVLLLESGVHAVEDAGVFGLEVGVELAEVGGQVGEVGVDQRLVLVEVLALHLLVQLKTARVPSPCIA